MLRELNADEVEFNVAVEPEYIYVEDGLVQDSGDEVADRAAEQEIINRINNGDDLAWVIITATAKWKEFEGYSHIGCCTFDHVSEIDSFVKDYELHEEALEDLNKTLKSIYDKLKELEN